MPFTVNGYSLDNCPACGRIPEMVIFGSKNSEPTPENMTIFIRCPRGCLNIGVHAKELNNEAIEKATEKWFIEAERYRCFYRGKPRNRFRFDLPPREIIVLMAEGNPGAVAAIMDMSRYWSLNAVLMELDYYRIYGERIYMLWNDCCDRDGYWAVKTLEFFKANNLPHSVIHGNFDRGRGTPFIPNPRKTGEQEEGKPENEKMDV